MYLWLHMSMTQSSSARPSRKPLRKFKLRLPWAVSSYRKPKPKSGLPRTKSIDEEPSCSHTARQDGDKRQPASSTGSPMVERLAEARPAATFCPDSHRLGGLPVDTVDDLPPEGAFSLGQSLFTQTFLEKLRCKLQIRLGALAAFIDFLGPASPALHIATQILRVNLQTFFFQVFLAPFIGICRINGQRRSSMTFPHGLQTNFKAALWALRPSLH